MRTNLRQRSCPVCGSTDTRDIYAAERFSAERLDAFSFAARKAPEFMNFRMVRCPICDVLYASPALPVAEICSGYREAHFDGQIQSRQAARSYAGQLQPLFAQLGSRQGALDIGTGDGAFLAELLDAGFHHVVGLEPSRAPIEQALPRVRPLIGEGFFAADRHRSNSFSLITCFQTIEHVDEPAALARDAFRLLQPGGALALVAHNYRSLSARLLRTNSPIFDIEHLQLFSPASLRRLFHDAGFSAVHVAPLTNAYHLDYWAKLLPLRQPWSGRLSWALQWLGLAQVTLPMRVGNTIAWGFRPRSSQS